MKSATRTRTRLAAIALVGGVLATLSTTVSAQVFYPGPYSYSYRYAPYYGYLYGGDGFPYGYGGYDGEVSGDDWYYDYYDSRYGYDDWWLDYYLDRRDVAELEARNNLDGLDFDDERFDVSDDGRPWYGDTYMDWDTLPDEDSYETGVDYDGYGFD